MSRILVERRNKSPDCRPSLDALASACRQIGHRVTRWRGPFSRKLLLRRWIPPCDLAILFNGAHQKYRDVVAKLRQRQTPILFVELGWYPQIGTFQLDHQGINAAASWAAEPLETVGQTRLTVPKQGDLLVILQCDNDTQITSLSPAFPDMYAFVLHVLRYSRMPVRVRAHPREAPDERLDALLRHYGAKWDDSPTLTAALKQCSALACVNSSCAVEALARRLPVLCYGRANFRSPGVVYCLDGDGEQTRAVTAELQAGDSALYVERVDAVVKRIIDNQWTVDQLPGRLAPVIDDLLRRPRSRETYSRGHVERPATIAPVDRVRVAESH